MTHEPQNPALQSPDHRLERLEAIKRLYPDLFTDEGKLNVEEVHALAHNFDVSLGEKFEFRWPGKMHAKKHAFTPSKARLAPDVERSVDFDKTQNVIIEGENLEVLKLLSKAYYNKVKCIYIDPPYNTGHDSVYSDDYSEGKQAYWEKNGLFRDGVKMDTNTESAGRYHTNWLNMMMPRLLLAQMMLKDEGAVFISIDDNEIHHLRKLMDEIFGEENFVAQLTVLCNPKGRSQDKYFATNHEYVLCYSKTQLPKGYFAIEKDAEQIAAEYSEEDDGGKYRLLELRNTHREFGKHNRPNLHYPFFVDDKSGEISLRKTPEGIAVYPDWDDGFNGCWAWGKEKSENETEFLLAKQVNGQWKIYRKSYASGAEKMLKSILNDKKYFTEKGQAVFNDLFETKAKLFPSPKSLELIKVILKTITKNEDIIVDFFAGSGTTGHAVMDLNQEDGGNRKSVMVQIPEATDEKSEAFKAGYKKISDITIERVKRAGERIHSEKPDVDTGFKVFKLTTSIFPENTYQPDPEKSDEENVEAFQEHLARAKQQLLFDPKNKETDLQYEMLIKQGFTLTMNKEKLDQFADNAVWKVTDGDRSALVCLDADLKESTIKALEGQKDIRFIGLHRAVDTTRKWELTQIFGESLVLF
ncbi:site-specific DNA-methyltransferase [Candidatus Uhrbacteria bacterium]|nr:site-specific DNA-methyltransferase [Candidatus Uhrbacteria bacterium]